jgi:hypothetical protein
MITYSDFPHVIICGGEWLDVLYQTNQMNLIHGMDYLMVTGAPKRPWSVEDPVFSIHFQDPNKAMVFKLSHA